MGGSSHLKRELAGIALTLLAVFLAGALFVHHPDPRGSCLAGGVFGPVGGLMRCALVGAVGLPAAALVCLLPLVHALRLFGRMESRTDREWLVFVGGVVVLLPVVIALVFGTGAESDAKSGLWGAFTAFYLARAFGTAGAWVIVALAVSALMAVTLSWNPIRAIIGRPVASPMGAGAVVLGGIVEGEPVAAELSNGRRKRGSKKALAPQSTAVALLEPPPEEMPAIDPTLMQESVVAADDDAVRDGRAGRKKKASKSDLAAVHADRIAAEIAATEVATPSVGDDELPSPDHLTPPPPKNQDVSRRELDAAGAKLMDALRTFKVEGELVGRTTGPTVTQFEVEPAPGVKVRQIANLSNDLALAMRAASIRIVAPIPGRGAVGVEVPNPSPEMVAFREMIESREFQQARAALPIALGKDLEGKPVVADLAKMPHLLIAGATGSGKSVCVNTIITSLVYRHTPKTLRFLMVDPKMVELSVYNTLPHLRHKVITDNRDAAAVLKWAVMEMQERYELLAANGCRNVQDFNRRVLNIEEFKAADGAEPPAKLLTPRRPDVAFEDRTYKGGILPYIVVVIDEMADLMMTVQGEVETPIAMLAQKARAIGIHLILATQRPSVNVITGLIKANFPSRIAFRVASQVDSRTIIDGAGAEMLLGNGDMLFIPPGKSEASRLQGAYLSSEDTERLMRWYEAGVEAKKARWREQGLAVETADASEEDILQKVRDREREEQNAANGGGEDDSGESAERDKLFREAAEAVIHHQQGSTSLLQRRLKVGYGRAARIIDQLHFAGVLGPPDGSKPRDVLIGVEELDRVCGPRG
ncbi:MAG TPA: DNA translocase FtsK 4TM domain-containing protein [Gemmatimonadaceae bacterium]|nr:DNA translocase FtsK 4TM domain-containing protein [Gemmatimonadaceae bacterium]